MVSPVTCAGQQNGNAVEPRFSDVWVLTQFGSQPSCSLKGDSRVVAQNPGSGFPTRRPFPADTYDISPSRVAQATKGDSVFKQAVPQDELGLRTEAAPYPRCPQHDGGLRHTVITVSYLFDDIPEPPQQLMRKPYKNTGNAKDLSVVTPTFPCV